MKVTDYFKVVSRRADRSYIKPEWIRRVVQIPGKEHIQADGRIRRWGRVPERVDRHLRVVLLEDGETVHTTFFDRGHKS